MRQRKYLWVLLMVLAAGGSVFAGNVYVDANLTTGANNGTSWANAFQGRFGLIDAMPGSGNTIYVATGTYLVSKIGLQTDSIAPNAGTTLKGGYETDTLRTGNDTVPKYDPFTYQSIISGDLNGDDAAVRDLWDYPNDLFLEVQPTRADNSTNLILIGNDNITIDGFVLTKAQFNGLSATKEGAGIRVPGAVANLVIRNCTFSLNAGTVGTAIYLNYGGSAEGALIDNCVFTQNCNRGRGIVCQYGGHHTCRNSIFSKNSAGGGGTAGGSSGENPGWYVFTGDGQRTYIYDCVFDRNRSDGEYGGNGYARGGPLHVRQQANNGNGSRLEVYNTVLSNNRINGDRNLVPGGGGAISVHGSEFTGNQTVTGLIKNCLVKNNSIVKTAFTSSTPPYYPYPWYGGAGIRCSLAADVDIQDTTVVYNNGQMALHSPYKGNGIQQAIMTAFPGTHPIIRIKDSIVWGNSGPDVQLDPFGTAGDITVSYSCIDDSDGDPNNIHTGTGVITTDPQFVANDPMYNVQATSPTIDTGDPTTDWSKEPKCNGERVNMGWTGASGKATPKVTVANVLDGDVNCDGDVNLVDFSKLASEWLQ